VHNYRGLVALDAEQIDRARTQCTMALDAFTAALGAEDPELVLAHVCLASIDRAQGRERAALDRARIAQRLADAAADPAHIYEAYDELSLDLDATGDRKGALAAVAKAIAGAEAAQLEVPDLKERQAKWQKSRR